MTVNTEKKSHNIQDLLGKKLDCSCGREHSATGIKKVIIEKGAIFMLPELLSLFGWSRVFMAADSNTYRVAGLKVENILTGSENINFKKHIFNREQDLIPDEASVGEFLLHMDRGAEVILAVGSGVMNDLCKYMSWRLGIPYIIVATAPSMDGFASDGSALIIDGLKTTLSTTVPTAIIGDTEILKDAPLNMIGSGLADMVGKYSAINDWKLSSLINGEYYCTFVADLVMESLMKCAKAPEKLRQRDEAAVKSLMEGLVMTGIAMSFTGNSRPASGAEHHLSHFMEMMCMFEGREIPLHGLKVGINTIIMTKMRKMLASEKPDFDAIEKNTLFYDKEKWAKDVKRLFKQAAPGIISLNHNEQTNSMDKRASRLKRIQENWERLVEILNDIPAEEQVSQLLSSCGAPVDPRELGFDADLTKDGLVYCKEIRARYTVLQLAWDLGLLEELSEEIGRRYSNG